MSWRECNVDANVRKAFEVATNISWLFNDEKIRTAYVLFAAMYNENLLINDCLRERGIYLIMHLKNILENKETFAVIFGEKAANEFYEDFQEDEKQEEHQEEEYISPKNYGLDSDEVTIKVCKVLNRIISEDIEQEDDGEDVASHYVEPVYSDKLQAACEDAYRRCMAASKDVIDLNTLTYCILDNKNTSGYIFIKNVFENLDLSIEEILYDLKIAGNIQDVRVDSDKAINEPVIPVLLKTCTTILNTKYKKGEICPILGRDKEIFRAFSIFSKKTKRNAVLVGHPGVGKTAIIEAITQSIVNETCPKEFIGYTVISLDINSMIAGTKYRGEFETKVNILVSFLESTSNIILFVDEMHQMIGAGGSTESTVDLSGSLKPILSRDDVVFVGATTTNEYNRIVSKDGAFKRRFEVIDIKEPKISQVKAMIRIKLENMQKYHSVKFPETLLDYVISCSSCFDLENCNPDRTLDLCDKAMAIAKMEGQKKVTKATVEKVYEANYEKYSKLGKSNIKATAYHEVGHYIVSRLTKQNDMYRVIAVSIVPGRDFMGVNISEEREINVSCDREYAESYIMSFLAGRVAQQKVSTEIDNGAREDLKQAKIYAKKVIAEFGMDEGEYKNMYLMDDDLFTEQLANKIDEKANKLIEKIYEKAESFINEHWEEIIKMANLLMKKKIVSAEELDRCLKSK